MSRGICAFLLCKRDAGTMGPPIYVCAGKLRPCVVNVVIKGKRLECMRNDCMRAIRFFISIQACGYIRCCSGLNKILLEIKAMLE